jgi:hypothetical protein
MSLGQRAAIANQGSLILNKQQISRYFKKQAIRKKKLVKPKLLHIPEIEKR